MRSTLIAVFGGCFEVCNLQEGNTYLENESYRKMHPNVGICPHYQLLLEAANLLGISDEEVANIDEFCGLLPGTPEDTIGGLAGRRGVQYDPKTFCVEVFSKLCNAITATDFMIVDNAPKIDEPARDRTIEESFAYARIIAKRLEATLIASFNTLIFARIPQNYPGDLPDTMHLIGLAFNLQCEQRPVGYFDGMVS